MSVIKAASNKRRTKRWRLRNGLMVPTADAVAEALDTIPAGPPWTWAALRVMPSIRGERVVVMSPDELEDMGISVPATDFPTVHMAPGIDVSCAVEADVVAIHVSQEHLDRWDKTIDEVTVAAMANLRRTVAAWNGRLFEDDSLDGIVIRQLQPWPQWAVALILLPDELKRIFGSHDQLFIAPYGCVLMSLPIDVDRSIAADIIDMFAVINPRSLLIGLPAFALRDGQLSVEDWPRLDDEPDLTESWPESGSHRLADLLGW